MSDDKIIVPICIRLPKSMVDEINKRYSKRGDKIKFFREMIEKRLKGTSGVNKCKECMFFDKCTLKTVDGRLNCIYYISQFDIPRCKVCRWWSKDLWRCMKVETYPVSFTPSDYNHCYLIAFDPITEGRISASLADVIEKRALIKRDVVVFDKIFKVSSNDGDEVPRKKIEKKDVSASMDDDDDDLERFSEDIDKAEMPVVRKIE